MIEVRVFLDVRAGVSESRPRVGGRLVQGRTRQLRLLPGCLFLRWPDEKIGKLSRKQCHQEHVDDKDDKVEQDSAIRVFKNLVEHLGVLVA